MAGEQAGTHWAAPAYFAADQAAADELDPGDFFHPAVVLDVRAEVKEDPDFALGIAGITSWEAEFGPVPAHTGHRVRADPVAGQQPGRAAGLGENHGNATSWWF